MAGDELDLVFAALADPTRRAILELLGDGTASVTEITQRFAVTQQAISRHLKVLERAGLISRGRVAQSRPCRLEPQHLDLAADWIDTHRQLWADRYDRLDAHLHDLTRKTGSPQASATQASATQASAAQTSAAQTRKESP